MILIVPSYLFALKAKTVGGNCQADVVFLSQSAGYCPGPNLSQGYSGKPIKRKGVPMNKRKHCEERIIAAVR
jgi:hypothetical protein